MKDPFIWLGARSGKVKETAYNMVSSDKMNTLVYDLVAEV